MINRKAALTILFFFITSFSFAEVTVVRHFNCYQDKIKPAQKKAIQTIQEAYGKKINVRVTADGGDTFLYQECDEGEQTLAMGITKLTNPKPSAALKKAIVDNVEEIEVKMNDSKKEPNFEFDSKRKELLIEFHPDKTTFKGDFAGDVVKAIKNPKKED